VECRGVGSSPDVVKVSTTDRFFFQKLRPITVISRRREFDPGSVESRIATRAAVSLDCLLQAILGVRQTLAGELAVNAISEEERYAGEEKRTRTAGAWGLSS
jgi:hypothetical protein